MVQVLPHTSTKQRGVSLEATFGWRGWECEAFGDFGFSTVKPFNRYFPRLGHHRKAPSSKKS